MTYTGQQKRDYQAAWIKQRRQDWIDSQGGVCVLCGSDDQLEIDHIDPALKTMQPAAIWSRSRAKMEHELDNCQVLCHSCHLAKTSEAYLTDHGTRSRYMRGCHCSECRAAQAAYLREWRK